jgi:hypothetical protein
MIPKGLQLLYRFENELPEWRASVQSAASRLKSEQQFSRGKPPEGRAAVQPGQAA